MLPDLRRAESERGKDAGSPMLEAVFGRPRTQHRDALQPVQVIDCLA